MAVAERLPAGAGVVFRGFGRPEAEAVAARLAAVARRRGLTLLVGADAALAVRVGAHGVHLPERMLDTAPTLRRRRPDWRLTGAAHSAACLRRADGLGLDALLLSPAFASASPSAAGAPSWGPARLAALARGGQTPVFALGGVTETTARRLYGVAGVAAVQAFLR